MEFKLKAYKRPEFDSELDNFKIENHINFVGHLATYNYDGEMLTIILHDSVAGKLTEKQIGILISIR